MFKSNLKSILKNGPSSNSSSTKEVASRDRSTSFCENWQSLVHFLILVASEQHLGDLSGLIGSNVSSR